MKNINIIKDHGLKELLQPVEEISRLAGAEIMRHYAGTGIYTKEDGSQVTDADHAAENLILPALRKLTPHIPIVSEERVAAGEIPDVSGGTFWAVDPLDGTKEFIHKTGAFVVAIALIVDHKPVMGVIYHPSMDLMYSAAGAGTASKSTGSRPKTPLLQPASLPDRFRVLVNESNADMNCIKDFLAARYPFTPHHIDTKSGILRACQVADGLADLSVIYTGRHEGRIAWWDVAPGHAIVESAGGAVKSLKGKPLVYDAGDLQVPAHVVISPHRA